MSDAPRAARYPLVHPERRKHMNANRGRLLAPRVWWGRRTPSLLQTLDWDRGFVGSVELAAPLFGCHPRESVCANASFWGVIVAARPSRSISATWGLCAPAMLYHL